MIGIVEVGNIDVEVPIIDELEEVSVLWINFTSIGNEVFYYLFFPFWIWNLDGAIARKVATVLNKFINLFQINK